ncbi:hypothetical protein GTI84_06170, partial [Escherichia coli]|nr:hypothetical protein [Escherichia coli]
DKVALLQGDLAKINPPKPVENGNGTGGDKPKDNKPLTDSNTGCIDSLEVRKNREDIGLFGI